MSRRATQKIKEIKQKRNSLVCIILVFVCMASFPRMIFAAGNATLSFSQATVVSETGKTFDIDVLVSANNEDLDTVRLNFEYPKDLLKVEVFTLGTLFPEVAPGNVIDNVRGYVSEGAFVVNSTVKTSGVFGKVTFRALNEGEAKVRILDTSKLISNGEEKINTKLLAGFTTTIKAGVLREGPFVLESSTHPDENSWYSNSEVSFTWKIKDDTKIKEFLVLFNTLSSTEPKDDASAITFGAQTLEYEREDVDDGVSYLHVQGKKEDGNFTETSHFRVQVDTLPPNAIAIASESLQLNEGDSNVLTFGTTDDVSGVDHYEISVNNEPYTIQTSPFIVENVAAGNYFMQVKAVDKADNVIFGQTTFRVYPKGVYEEGISREEKKELGTRQLWIIFVLILVAIGVIIKLTLQKRKK